MTIIECVKKEFEDVIVCNGTTYEKPERPLDYHNMWFWIYLGIYITLVIIAGKFRIKKQVSTFNFFFLVILIYDHFLFFPSKFI